MTLMLDLLSPLRGSFKFSLLTPRADALGYTLPRLRRFRPSVACCRLPAVALHGFFSGGFCGGCGFSWGTSSSMMSSSMIFSSVPNFW